MSLHMQAFTREHFVMPKCFQKLSEVETCTFDCGHKLGAEKKKIIMLTFFSMSAVSQ